MRARGDAGLLWPEQVGALFRVDAKTASRWGNRGRLLVSRTLGGRRRFYEVEVRALLRGETPEKARELAEAERARISGGRHA